MASKRKRKDRAAAIITIRDAARMTARGRRNVADWLVRQARFLREHGQEYSDRFTGRYLYR